MTKKTRPKARTYKRWAVVQGDELLSVCTVNDLPRWKKHAKLYGVKWDLKRVEITIKD